MDEGRVKRIPESYFFSPESNHLVIAQFNWSISLKLSTESAKVCFVDFLFAIDSRHGENNFCCDSEESSSHIIIRKPYPKKRREEWAKTENKTP